MVANLDFLDPIADLLDDSGALMARYDGKRVACGPRHQVPIAVTHAHGFDANQNFARPGRRQVQPFDREGGMRGVQYGGIDRHGT
jgi:hypothetical protein